jgi:multidrug efflux system membrane fusion protein
MKSKKFLWLASGLFIAISVFVATAKFGPSGQAAEKRDSGEKAIPVILKLAERRNAPVYLNSIATAQALNTVLVRARVDGEISRVVFDEGKNVKRGDILVELDRRPFVVQLRAALAQLEKDKSQFANTKRDIDRYEFLVKNDSLATQTLDATRAQYEQLKAAMDADKAQIDAAQLQLDYATIRSPIDGRLGARLVDAGNLVHAGDTNGLVTVTQIQPLFVSFSLPQNELQLLRQQQERNALRVVAYSQDGSDILDTGELTLIDSQIDPATGTIHCKAKFGNAQQKLWPGAFVSVRVMLNDLQNIVVVPTSAIQAGAQHSYVYVVTKDNVAKAVPIEAGPISGSDTVILAGLSGNERIVIEGQFQLDDGAKVEEKHAPPEAPAKPVATHS